MNVFLKPQRDAIYRSMRTGFAVLTLVFMLVACTGYDLYVRPGLDPRCPGCEASLAQLDYRVLLIGDTGEARPEGDALDLLAELSDGARDRSIALFLGDNIYPRGMPASIEDGVEAERVGAEEIMNLQIEAVEKAGIEAVFIPGNHDWDRSGSRGLGRVHAQKNYLDKSAKTTMHPMAGCPGPTILDLGDSVRVIAVDSEWILRVEDKDTACEWGPLADQQMLSGTDPDSFYAALAEAVQEAGTRRVLLATHHPLKTRGPHGGYFTAKDLIFPLTLYKSWLYLPVPLIYPPLRYGVYRSDQDLYGSRNREMVRRIQEVLASADLAPIAAAGHEHTLQVFDDTELPIWYLVSGSGAKIEATGKTDDTMFKHAAPGVMAIDFFIDGRVSVRVIEALDTGNREVFALWLSP